MTTDFVAAYTVLITICLCALIWWITACVNDVIESVGNEIRETIEATKEEKPNE